MDIDGKIIDPEANVVGTGATRLLVPLGIASDPDNAASVAFGFSRPRIAGANNHAAMFLGDTAGGNDSSAMMMTDNTGALPTHTQLPSCAELCQIGFSNSQANAYTAFVAAKDGCGFSWSGTGCAAGIVCAPGGVKGVAACCVIGGIGGGVIGYFACVDAAENGLRTAMQTARNNYIACMAACGITVVWR